MQIITNLADIPSLKEPIGLSIGMFDGMHPGHQSLLRHLRAKTQEGSTAVLTFSNHPSQAPLLCTVAHKLHQLQQEQIDLTLLLPFTPAFSQQPFDLFLKTLRMTLPFSYLILGEGATFGKDRQGTPEKIQALAQSMYFHAEYIPKISYAAEPVSSGRIRQAIESGNLALGSQLLGRPYSIAGPIHQSTMHLPHLCLPPDGAYPVKYLTHNGLAHINRQTHTLHLAHPSPLTLSFLELLLIKPQLG